MNLILASNSPARRSMLENAGYRFQAQPSAVDEEPIKKQAALTGLALPDLALELAIAKASDVAAPTRMRWSLDQIRFSSVKVQDCRKWTAHKQPMTNCAACKAESHQLHSAVAVCKNSQVTFPTCRNS
jgi:septum formation protein